MKQKNLIKKLYQACIVNEVETLKELRQKEFQKIFKHKDEGKTFNTKWTVVKI